MTHLVEVRINPRRLASWAKNVRIATADEDYIVHSVLCAAYGDLRPRPFVIKPGGPDIRVLGYASVSAGDLEAARKAAAEPQVDGCFVSEFSKEMPSNWKPGQMLSFEVRAAVTRQRANRAGEVDAFMLANDGQTREEAYVEWLSKRMEHAVDLRSIEIVGYRRVQVARRGADGNRRRLLKNVFTLPEVVFKGTFAVKNPESFASMVEHGVGRHKAFGFGALLLRPAA